MRRLLPLLLALALVAVAGSLGPAPAGAEGVTPGLQEARDDAQRLVDQMGEAETRLGELEGDIAEAEADLEVAEKAMATLRLEVQQIAVDEYTRGGVDPVLDGDLDRQLRATALSKIVRQNDADAIDEYRSTSAALEQATAELDEKRGEQEQVVADLEGAQEQLNAELARLEQLDRQRIEDERRQAEEEARQAREAAAREAAQAEAERLARQQAAAEAGKRAAEEAAAASTTTTTPAPSAPTTTAPPPQPAAATPAQPVAVAAPSGGGMVCVVPGSVFRNSWGEPRSGGRAHQGVDMMAPTGTPILAPVSGTVTHGSDGLGGLNFRIAGDDGNQYYGAHLSAFGQAGQVSAGTVIGYVGETGNAVGSHLHYAISIGGAAVNPYPYVAASC